MAHAPSSHGHDEHRHGRKADEKEALIDKGPKEPVELVVFLRDREGVYFHLEDGHLIRADELLELVIYEQGLPAEANDVFSLWFVSSILDVRLKNFKKHHQPFQIVQHWDELCALYTDANNDEIRDSEPVLMVQRDVFYPLEQALIHLGRFSPHTHLLASYRANLVMFYPESMYTKERFLFFASLRPQARDDCEELFMQAHQAVSQEFGDLDLERSLPALYRQYLQVCWASPSYGAAFFSGEVETPSSRLKKLILPTPDTRVLAAINTRGVSIVDRNRSELLLSVPFSQLSWEFRDPDFDGDNDPPPCLFLQFVAAGGGGGGNAGGEEAGNGKPHRDAEGGRGQGAASGVKPVTKLLKVFSREAKLMDALIETCVRRKLQQQQQVAGASPGTDVVDSPAPSAGGSTLGRVQNRLERLCLSTFSKDGEQLEAADK